VRVAAPDERRPRSEGESALAKGATGPGPRPGPQLEHRAPCPKDGELCVARAKPGEIQVEVRRDVDVQITLVSCVKGRKTRTI